MKDSPATTKFCADCSSKLIKAWTGWPLRDAIPVIPEMFEGQCGVCHGDRTFKSTDFAWLNIHGPYSTGLPDHWEIICSPNISVERLHHHWGAPYIEVGKCSCGKKAIVSSHMKSFVSQCDKCGFKPINRDRKLR